MASVTAKFIGTLASSP